MKTRKHIRLRNFDYSSQAWYFITICTKNREHSLGEIENGQMHLSAIGVQANLYWEEIPKHFPHIELGEFIIMPNHIHGIIGIVRTISQSEEIQNKKKYNIVRTRHVVSQQGQTNKFRITSFDTTTLFNTYPHCNFYNTNDFCNFQLVK